MSIYIIIIVIIIIITISQGSFPCQEIKHVESLTVVTLCE